MRTDGDVGAQRMVRVATLRWYVTLYWLGQTGATSSTICPQTTHTAGRVHGRGGRDDTMRTSQVCHAVDSHTERMPATG